MYLTDRKKIHHGIASMNLRHFSKTVKRFRIILLFVLVIFPRQGIVRADIPQPQAPAPHIVAPRIGAPLFIKPGETFSVDTSFPQGTLPESFMLRRSDDPGRSVSFNITPADTAASPRFNLTLDTAVAPGLYDLCVNFKAADAAETQECEPHAVDVISAFKDSFRFVVLSDIHVGDVRAGSNHPGMLISDLRALGFKTAAGQNPDFALLTGDLTVYPNSFMHDYGVARNEYATLTDYPVFTVPGNHDLDTMIRGMKQPRLGEDYWHAFFGPLHYSFTYGKWRFIGFNTYGWPAKLRDRFGGILAAKYNSDDEMMVSRDEYNWLKSELEAARSGGYTIALFCHHSPYGMVNDAKIAEEVGGTTADEIKQLLKDYGVKYYFYGHTHHNSVEKLDGVTFINTGSLGSDLGDGTPEPGWSFRVVDAKQDGTLETNVVFFHKPVPEKEGEEK